MSIAMSFVGGWWLCGSLAVNRSGCLPQFVNKIAAVCAAVTVPTSPFFLSFFPGSTMTARSVPCAVPHGQMKWSLPSMSRFSSLFSAASVLLSSLGGPCGEFHSNAALVELPRVLRSTLANGPLPVSLPSVFESCEEVCRRLKHESDWLG